MRRPAERPSVLEEGVFLLDPEHRLLVAVLLDHLTQVGPGVGRVGGEVGELDLAHDQLVVGTPQRVGDHEHRPQDAVRVVPQRLVGARSVESPDPRVLAVRDDLGLAPEERRWLGPVDPDVLSLVRHMNSSIARLLCCSSAPSAQRASPVPGDMPPGRAGAVPLADESPRDNPLSQRAISPPLPDCKRSMN